MSYSTESSSFVPKNLKDLLKLVECPLLNNQDDSWLNELLFSTSDNHLEFLKWMLASIDHDAAIFDEKGYAKMSTGEKQEHLLKISSALGICQTNELEVIKGSASQPALFQFWMNFLKMYIAVIKNGRNQTENDRNNMLSSATCINDLRPHKKTSILLPVLQHDVKKYVKSHELKLPSQMELEEMLSKPKHETAHKTSRKEIQQDFHSELIESLDQMKFTSSGLIDCHKQFQPWLKPGTNKGTSLSLEPLFQKASQEIEKFSQMLQDLSHIVTTLTDMKSANLKERKTEPIIADVTEVVGILNATLQECDNEKYLEDN